MPQFSKARFISKCHLSRINQSIVLWLHHCWIDTADVLCELVEEMFPPTYLCVKIFPALLSLPSLNPSWSMFGKIGFSPLQFGPWKCVMPHYSTKKNEGNSRSAESRNVPPLNFVKTMTQRIHYLLMKLCSAVVHMWWNLCAVLWCCSSRVSSAHSLSLVDLTYLLFEDFHAVTAYSTYAAFTPIVPLDFPHRTASMSGSRNLLRRGGAVPLVPFLSPFFYPFPLSLPSP